MVKVITHTKNCIAEVLNYLILICLEALILGNFARQWPGFFFFVVPVVIPLCFYVIRLHINRISVFLLLHILTIILFWFFYGETWGQKVVIAIVACTQAVKSLQIRVTRQYWHSEVVLPAIAVAVMVGAYIVDQFMGITIVSVAIMQIAIGFLFLYFLYYYLARFLDFINMNKRMIVNIPERQIFTSGGIMVGVFAVISGILIKTAADESFAKTVSAFMRRAVSMMIRFLFSLLEFMNPYQFDIQAEESAQEIVQEIPLEQVETSVWAELVDRLLVLGGMVITICLIGSIIYGLIRLIQKAFAYRNRQNTADEAGGYKDLVEKIEKRSRNKQGQRQFEPGASPEVKIRRIFQKIVKKKLKGKKEDMLTACRESSTAREYEFLFEGAQQEPLKEFISIYEKARYSHGDCTKEDVKRAKALAAQL